MPKRVAMMSGQSVPWNNNEVAKDCGLVPYLMMKNHGCEAFMVCGKGNDYPYLELICRSFTAIQVSLVVWNSTM